MEVYLTKYALSDGHISREEVSKHSECGNYVYLRRFDHMSFKIGRDVFADLASAKVAAEAVRAKKIKSLEAQIAKLEAMDFSGGDHA